MADVPNPKPTKNRAKSEKPPKTKKTDVAPEGDKKKKRKSNKAIKSIMPSSHIIKIVKDAAVFGDCRLSCKSAEVIKDLIDRVYLMYETKLVDIMAESGRKRVNMADFYTANMLVNQHDIQADIVKLVSGTHGRHQAKKVKKSKKADNSIPDPVST